MKKYGKLVASITLGLALATVGVTESYAAQVTYGENTVASGTDAVAVGNFARAWGNGTIAIGNNAVTGDALSLVENTKAIAIGNDVSIASTMTDQGNEFAIGFGNNVTIGDPTDTEGSAYAIGFGTDVTVKGQHAMALGSQSEADGKYAQAIGYDVHALSENAVAVGVSSWANADDSLAVGVGAIADANYSVALGAGAMVNNENSVALGSDSMTGDAVAVSSATIAGTMYNFAGANPFATVSVGKAGQERQIQNVAAGRITATSTDAINGSQLFGVITEVNKLNDRVTTIEGNTGGSITNYVEKVEQNGDNLTFTQVSGSNDDGTPNTDTSFTYTDKHITDLQQSMSGYTDANKGQITTTITTNEKDADGNDKTYESKVDISGYVSDAIREEVKDATITVDGNETTIENAITNNKNEIANNKNEIANIYNSVNDNANRINSLSNRLDKVGAGAAALASLHPMDFDPDDKLSFAAGFGNYAGENAGAVGVFYRPNEKVMMNVGATLGNGEDMVSAGISFALGKGGKVNASKVAMAHEIEDLRLHVAELTAMVNNIVSGSYYDFEGSAMMFPDVEENHWAYDYVEKLANAGIIEGYPSGNYIGERSMTRYEFAAMLYRALEKGIQIDAELIKEFEPELGRIRIDHIRGKGTNKVERVRVNTGKYRDSYGGK